MKDEKARQGSGFTRWSDVDIDLLLDPKSIERLVQLMPSAFQQVKTELLIFAEFLEQVGQRA